MVSASSPPPPPMNDTRSPDQMRRKPSPMSKDSAPYVQSYNAYTPPTAEGMSRGTSPNAAAHAYVPDENQLDGEAQFHYSRNNQKVAQAYVHPSYVNVDYHQPQSAVIGNVYSGDIGGGEGSNGHSRTSSQSSMERIEEELANQHLAEDGVPAQMVPQLAYHHNLFEEDGQPKKQDDLVESPRDTSPDSSQENGRPGDSSSHLAPTSRAPNRKSNQPLSMYSVYSQMRPDRDSSPGRARIPSTAAAHHRTRSVHSSDSRRSSSSDPLNNSYTPVVATFDNSHLQEAVGANASLMSHQKTLQMYRENLKKTTDPNLHYEFALFLVSAAQAIEVPPDAEDFGGRSPRASSKDVSSSEQRSPAEERDKLLKEARPILQRLADRSFPYAQYFLADALSSGLFNNGKGDLDKAFPLFVAASKHGHAEAGYRAALSYEFGWGCRKDPQKAVQFYRTSASKNHPGAMMRLADACLKGNLGIQNGYKEGLKWLKRANDVADTMYPNAPYELAVMHENGDGRDVFKDEVYAIQLFTRAAELGHAYASYRLGDAYEHGKLECPKDPALSIHFYTGAAEKGVPEAMMALCAWYLVGAEPILEADQDEAYLWARKAADSGFHKAEYAVGYFTEMGIGTRPDGLEANVWYVRAAEHGDDRAKSRLQTIAAAASKEIDSYSKNKKKNKDKPRAASQNRLEKEKPGDDKECIIM